MGLGGLFLALIGATDSYQYSLTLRLSLWLGLCAVAWFFAFAIEAAIKSAGARWQRPIVWWAALSACLAAAMVPVIFLVNSNRSEAPWGDLWLFAGNSIAISAALTAIRMVVGNMFAEPVSAQIPAAESGAGTPAILGRLTPALQTARLLALESEGHYVRVITDTGSELVLIRLRDAMAEVGAVEGMQVHRSWWLAREAVGETRSRDGKLEVSIGEDRWVPISRSYRAAWREAGW